MSKSSYLACSCDNYWGLTNFHGSVCFIISILLLFFWVTNSNSNYKQVMTHESMSICNTQEKPEKKHHPNQAFILSTCFATSCHKRNKLQNHSLEMNVPNTKYLKPYSQWNLSSQQNKFYIKSTFCLQYIRTFSLICKLPWFTFRQQLLLKREKREKICDLMFA